MFKRKWIIWNLNQPSIFRDYVWICLFLRRVCDQTFWKQLTIISRQIIQGNHETSLFQHFVHKHPNIKNNIRRRTGGVESHLTQWFNYSCGKKKCFTKHEWPKSYDVKTVNMEFPMDPKNAGWVTSSPLTVTSSKVGGFWGSGVFRHKKKSKNGGLLVGGWTNPSLKIWVKLGSSSPIFGVKRKNM